MVEFLQVKKQRGGKKRRIKRDSEKCEIPLNIPVYVQWKYQKERGESKMDRKHIERYNG